MKEQTKEERSYKERQKEEVTGNLIKESGQFTLSGNSQHHRIHLLNIVGEIEGHECLPSTAKTTKYEHVLPLLAEIEDNQHIDGMLVLLNTVGGDVEAGLAMAEMIGFTVAHSGIEENRLRSIMMNTQQLVKDIGSMLVGKEAVEEGLIDAVGGIHEAMEYLHGLIEQRKQQAVKE